MDKIWKSAELIFSIILIFIIITLHTQNPKHNLNLNDPTEESKLENILEIFQNRIRLKTKFKSWKKFKFSKIRILKKILTQSKKKIIT